MFEEADKANEQSAEDWQAGRTQRNEFIVAEESKRLREQWHLGNFARLYNEGVETKLTYAEHLPEGERPQPDFVVYDPSGILCCHVEVTEWLEVRKRDEEYSGPFSECGRLVGGMPDPTDKLRIQLTKKIREKAPSYPSNTLLLIDDNVGLGLYAWADKPLGDVEVAQKVVNELMQPAPENISEVWLVREVSRPMTVHHLWSSTTKLKPTNQSAKSRG
jgi:hypothetical protein